MIGIRTNEGWKTIYNHSDSYPDYLGKMLKAHYNTSKKAEELIGLGDLSYVRKDIGEKHNFDKAYEEHPDWTLAYGRDRGEMNIRPKTFKTLEELYNHATNTNAEYVYIFDAGKWKTYKVDNTLVPVSTKRNSEKKLNYA